VETCARCHSRRGQLWGEHAFGQYVEQTHRVVLVEEDLYFADGQQDDEVFEYGSFAQSRMYTAGVSCRDCHDPHSGDLSASGNELCTRCHAPEAFDAAAHHFHRPGSEASRCVTCHMPARTYMRVDSRRDHAFRVPRPDESVRFGTPNACGTGGCHDNRPAAWAAEAVIGWHGPGAAARPSFTRALAAGRSGQLDGAQQLLALAGDRGAPAIVRATAVSLLGGFSGPLVVSGVERAATDPEPRVRRAAAALLDLLDETTRIRIGAALVADDVRSVRLEAVTAVAPLAAALDVNAQGRLEAVIAEFRASQAFNSDSASAWVSLATLELALGRETDAEQALRAALNREPYLVPAAVNLADLLQRRGNEPAAERTLRDAIARTPDQAALHHALGLSLVRQRRRAEAMTELARAASLAPEETRYAYVYAVALHDSGDADGARRALEAAQQRRPADRAVLEALLAYAVERGDREDARRWAEAVATSAPGDRAAAARVQQLLQRTLTRP
jgi:predicted CXXCH cytochrome family protein